LPLATRNLITYLIYKPHYPAAELSNSIMKMFFANGAVFSFPRIQTYPTSDAGAT